MTATTLGRTLRQCHAAPGAAPKGHMKNTQPTPVRVIDLSSVRVRRGPRGRGWALLDTDGAVLAVTGASAGQDPREVAYALFDAALRAPNDPCAPPVAWYNPYTHAVTTTVRGECVSFGDHRPLQLQPSGSQADLLGASLDTGGGRTLPRLTQSLSTVTRDREAHRAA